MPKFYILVDNKKTIIEGEIPFDTQVELTSKEISKLYIDMDGLSYLYPDSYFEAHFIGDNFQLIRHQLPNLPEVYIPHLGQKETLSFKNFIFFQEKKTTDPNFPPIFAIPKFPENQLIGSGAMGQVHKVMQNDQALALKLSRTMHAHVREGRIFTLCKEKESFAVSVSPLSATNMHRSFKDSYYYWTTLSKLPMHQNIAGIKGIAYIEDLNQWGVLYDYIDGITFDFFCYHYEYEVVLAPSTKTKLLIQMAIQLCDGLSVLDDAGCTHTDLLEPNILVRKGSFQPVLIDYEHRKIKGDSLTSRCQYGRRIEQLAKILKNNNFGLDELAKECQDSSKSFLELNWQTIIGRLTTIQASLDAKSQSNTDSNQESVPSSIYEADHHNNINYLLNTYLKDRTAITDSSGVTKEYFYSSCFSFFQKSFTQKRSAVGALKSALNGENVDLSEHLSTLRNGNLGKKLRAFIKSGMGNALVGKEVTTVSDFVQALQENNSNRAQPV